MTVKRKVRPLLALPPGLRPARWHGFHTGLLIVALIVMGLSLFFPANSAAAAGQIVLDEDNARYMRAGMALFALWVAFGIRGQPWWHVVICMLIAFFARGQMVRAEYTAEVTGVPLSLMWANLACLFYLFVLAWRPSVHERLEERDRQLAESQAEIRRLRGP